MVEECHIDEAVRSIWLREPSDLLGLAEVAVEVELHLDRGDDPGCVGRLGADDRVAPVHEADLLLVLEGDRILLLDEDLGRVHGFLVADLGVLLVLRQCLDLNRGGAAFDRDQNTVVQTESVNTTLLFCNLVDHSHVRIGECPETRSNRVDDLLVQSPECIPLERDDRLRRALGKHVLVECLHREPTATDTAHSGEAGVVPSAYDTGVYEPMEFTLAAGYKT